MKLDGDLMALFCAYAHYFDSSLHGLADLLDKNTHFSCYKKQNQQVAVDWKASLKNDYPCRYELTQLPNANTDYKHIYEDIHKKTQEFFKLKKDESYLAEVKTSNPFLQGKLVNHETRVIFVAEKTLARPVIPSKLSEKDHNGYKFCAEMAEFDLTDVVVKMLPVAFNRYEYKGYGMANLIMPVFENIKAEETRAYIKENPAMFFNQSNNEKDHSDMLHHILMRGFAQNKPSVIDGVFDSAGKDDLKTIFNLFDLQQKEWKIPVKDFYESEKTDDYIFIVANVDLVLIEREEKYKKTTFNMVLKGENLYTTIKPNDLLQVKKETKKVGANYQVKSTNPIASNKLNNGEAVKMGNHGNLEIKKGAILKFDLRAKIITTFKEGEKISFNQHGKTEEWVEMKNGALYKGRKFYKAFLCNYENEVLNDLSHFMDMFNRIYWKAALSVDGSTLGKFESMVDNYEILARKSLEEAPESRKYQTPINAHKSDPKNAAQNAFKKALTAKKIILENQKLLLKSFAQASNAIKSSAGKITSDTFNKMLPHDEQLDLSDDFSNLDKVSEKCATLKGDIKLKLAGVYLALANHNQKAANIETLDLEGVSCPDFLVPSSPKLSIF